VDECQPLMAGLQDEAAAYRAAMQEREAAYTARERDYLWKIEELRRDAAGSPIYPLYTPLHTYIPPIYPLYTPRMLPATS